LASINLCACLSDFLADFPDNHRQHVLKQTAMLKTDQAKASTWLFRIGRAGNSTRYAPAKLTETTKLALNRRRPVIRDNTAAPKRFDDLNRSQAAAFIRTNPAAIMLEA